MQKFFDGFDVHWFVNKGDKESYERHGGTNVHECGTLCDNRNEALNYSWDNGQDCIQTDDDLIGIKLAYSKDTNDNKDITFKETIDIMDDAFFQMGLKFKLAGVAPTINNFFYNPNKPISIRHFIVGNIMLIKKCGLYFDTNLKVKEDFDYTLQHIQKFGGVVRCNNILANLKHRTNKGGCVEYRTELVEQEAIKYLKEKWGSAIRDNPKRPNEVLLNVK